jgi:hypothetical protein
MTKGTFADVLWLRSLIWGAVFGKEGSSRQRGDMRIGAKVEMR